MFRPVTKSAITRSSSFKHFAQNTPEPSIQHFGGEPTVRKDLIEIIRLSRSYGLPTRVVTNGVRLADEEYFPRVVGILCRQKTKTVLRRFTAVQAALQIIVLPFGDEENMETDRLQRCPAAFAYVDPKDGQVKHVANCAWGLHKAKVLREIADPYAKAGPAGAPIQTSATA